MTDRERALELLRRHPGWSDRHVAALVGVAHSTVSRWRRAAGLNPATKKARRWRGRTIATSAIAALTLALATPALAWNDFPTLDAAASTVAGYPVTVHCTTWPEWDADPGVQASIAATGDAPLAFVPFTWDGTRYRPEPYTVFPPDWCAVLVLFVQDPTDRIASRLNDRPDLVEDEAAAILYLAHETARLVGMGAFPGEPGYRDVDCFAVAHFVQLARALGATAARARVLAKLAGPGACT